MYMIGILCNNAHSEIGTYCNIALMCLHACLTCASQYATASLKCAHVTSMAAQKNIHRYDSDFLCSACMHNTVPYGCAPDKYALAH